MEIGVITFIISVFTLSGYNFTFWLIIGFIRLCNEKLYRLTRRKTYKNSDANTISVRDIAAVIPAHNEELTIGRTITALLKVLPKRNIYVASDYSTDKTIKIARSFGVRLLDINPNLGKAKSIVMIMKQYNLLDAYKLIFINDADTEISQDYLTYALPFFNDRGIGAVATHGITRWQHYSFWQKYFIAYRIRLWRIIQFGMRFGQTWKYTNVSFIVPGSLSLYRTSVLKQIEIDAQGLIIEDFNMTFEMRKKKLGSIGYSPKLVGIHQDPYRLHDYIKQVQRWNVGFFQTVKRHGIWPSIFWLATTAYYVELYLYALFIGLLPLILLLYILNGFSPLTIPLAASNLRFGDLLIGVFFMDYVITIIAAIFEKKPFLLFYGLGFIFLRYIDSLIYLGSPIRAFTLKSKGTWVSPKRL